MNAEFQYAMDYDFWIRVASQYQIRHLPVVLANERHYATSKTVSAPELGLKGRIHALEHFSTRSHQPDICSLKRRALATHCFKLSRYYLGAGDFIAARAYALRALRIRPPMRLMGKQFTYVRAWPCTKPSIWNVAAENRTSLCKKHKYLSI